MKQFQPIESTVTYKYSRALGGRTMSAGITIFVKRSPQPLSIEPCFSGEGQNYWQAVLKGLNEGVKATFPEETFTGIIEVKELEIHSINSSEFSFYICAKTLIASLPTLLKSNQ